MTIRRDQWAPLLCGAGAITIVVLVVLLLSRPTPQEKQAPPPHVNTTYQVPLTITADCSQEVSGPLLDWIAKVPDHSILSFIPGACYNIEASLLIRHRHDLTFEGNGAKFLARTDGSAAPRPSHNDFAIWFRWPRARAQFILDGSTNLTVRNLVVQGANPQGGPRAEAFDRDLAEQEGFLIIDGHRIVIEGCTITDTYSDFVTIGLASSDITVRKGHFERSGRMGLSVVDGNDISFEDNFLSGVGRDAFDIEPARADWHAHRIRITNNLVGEVFNNFFSNVGAGSDVGEVEISNNELRGMPMTILIEAPDGMRRSHYVIVNNRSDALYGSGVRGVISARNIDDLRVAMNEQPFAPGNTGRGVEPGVALANCNHVVVEQNRFILATSAVGDSSEFPSQNVQQRANAT